MSERSEVKRDGAKAQKNSGRGDYQKGDAKWKQFLVDYKEASSSFTLNKPVWSKICTDTFNDSANTLHNHDGSGDRFHFIYPACYPACQISVSRLL